MNAPCAGWMLEYDTNWVRSQPYLSRGFFALLRAVLRTDIGVGGMISPWEESGSDVGVSGVGAGVGKGLGTSSTVGTIPAICFPFLL